MLGNHENHRGTDNPRFLVTTHHVADGVICHHTGATLEEVMAFAAEHAEAPDELYFYAMEPYRLDGVHWQLIR
ncbi:MAG: hypothetical protein ACTHOG_12835 [Marmoricola sp.]|jgi:hypothetical protein